MPLGAPLVAQTAFVIKKWAPSDPEMRSRIEKIIKNDTKELSECENELRKWTLFGARWKWASKVDPFRIQARRTARRAYNIKKYSELSCTPTLLCNSPKLLWKSSVKQQVCSFETIEGRSSVVPKWYGPGSPQQPSNKHKHTMGLSSFSLSTKLGHPLSHAPSTPMQVWESEWVVVCFSFYSFC